MPDFAKRLQRSLGQRRAATDRPAMGIALGELAWQKVGLAKVRENRMDNAARIRREPSQLWPHAFAAHQTNAGELRDRARDSLLQRLQPKCTFPGRARGKELVENGKEAAAAVAPEIAQSRDQAKRNSARLIAVIHVIQNNVIEFRAGQLAR